MDISLDNYVLINQVVFGIKSTDYIMINKIRLNINYCLIKYYFNELILKLIFIRTKCMNQVRQIFKQVDFIATPTCGGTALKILDDDKTCKILLN